VTDEREELRLQARLLVRPAPAPLVDVVVSQLDDRGPLPARRPPSAGSSWTGTDWADAVRAVRAAGPPGVAAADVHACLLAQARWHASRGGRALLVPLVADHLPEVAQGITKRSRPAGRRPGLRWTPPWRSCAAGCGRPR
jgi:RNA polymerase sigma-54 factor